LLLLLLFLLLLSVAVHRLLHSDDGPGIAGSSPAGVAFDNFDWRSLQIST